MTKYLLDNNVVLRFSNPSDIQHSLAKALTAKARVTIRLLQLNRRHRIEERQLLLEAGILDFSRFK